MSQSKPPEISDENVRTKIDDWRVPIQVGAQKGAITGTLTWVPLPGGALPTGAIFAFAALLIVLLLTVFAVRRRRAGAAPRDEVVEAW
jgi:hypothetical protein